jgi:CRISPR-associated protein Cas1
LSEVEQEHGIIPDLIPASMLAAFAYCPRLCYIQWVQGEFQDSAETVDGRFQHRFVDAQEDDIPEGFQPFHARSVSLTAPQAGICCRIDLLEGDGSVVTPVEYKRGEAPKTPAGPYEPYQIQLCAQALALRENGFSSEEGMVYFIRSKERVTVKIDPETVDRTKKLIEDLRRTAEKGEMPPPLRASARCNCCSLAGICLPDEVNGRIIYDQGKYDEAIKCYDEAIRLDPNLAMAWNYKGWALKALGKTTEADAAFAKAKELGYIG